MEKWQRLRFQPNLPLGKDGQRVTACAEHVEFSKNAAKEGMVLLKNENKVLPFDKGVRLALFGKATIDYVKGGGGSGDVTVSGITNLYEGFKKQTNVTVFEELVSYYQKEVAAQYADGIAPGMTREPEVPDALLKKARAFTDTAVISICRFSGEGWDRKCTLEQNQEEGSKSWMEPKGESVFERGDFYLTNAETAMVEKVKAAFPKVVVVMNVGGMVDTQWFKDDADIDAVLMAWQGGMEGGTAAAELLMGIGTPSGKLSDTFAKELADYPSTEGFHESEYFVHYTEDIYVGYRYFETIPDAKEKVNYPFGFGLSYTDFEIALIKAKELTEEISMQVQVTNTGAYAGKEVVQVYVQAPQGKLMKPAKVLVAFQKTRLLQPGETQLLNITFPVSVFASYDDLGKVQKSAWILEAGEYFFHVGNSVRDTEKWSGFSYCLTETKIIEQVSEKLKPNALEKRLLSDGTYEELETFERPEEVLPQARMECDKFDGLMPDIRAQKGFNGWIHRNSGVPLLIDVAEGKLTMDELVASLTDEELADLLGGQPNTGVANTFGFGNNPYHGIPNAMTADGPAGLRITKECGVCTTAFPCSTMLACSWDSELVFKVGETAAKEVKENNIAIWLTPAINIHRSPLCGRNFEYYSEDPLLTGKLAAAMVQGIQSQHISPSVKHFAFNNKETNRRNSDSRVSERAAREIYLKAFEIIVKEADPWCIMSSYNLVNGVRTSESRELLEDILRDEWGFNGVVTTDWWNLGEQYVEIQAGNDIKMGRGYVEVLLKALQSGAISREAMEVSAKRVLELILKFD